MVSPPCNGPKRHPGGKCIGWHQRLVAPTIVNQLLTQWDPINRATSRLWPDLRMAQSLPSYVLLQSPPLGPHLRDPQPGRSHRYVPPPYPFSIGRPSELTTKCDAGPGPLNYCTRPNIQGKCCIVAEKMNPCGCQHAGVPTHHKELRAGEWVLIGQWRAPHTSHVPMASTHWALQAAIWQGICSKPLLWSIHIQMHPQLVASLPAPMKHEMFVRSGYSTTVWVWRAPEACELNQPRYVWIFQQPRRMIGISRREAVVAVQSRCREKQRLKITEIQAPSQYHGKFGEIFNSTCQEGHLCPMGTNGREICVRFY